jgi:hypothetical protein
VEERGLKIDEKAVRLAPQVWKAWVEFNIANEPLNCLPVIWVPKSCPMLGKSYTDVLTTDKPWNPFANL